ncbi:alpha/beta fold hydrolase, partial [Reyranella sp.]|uniref:alpha/beta fold hydrolase n=1 Tax=Reyranella sp. TaxID=1929291 RepID=UPI003D100F19
PTLLLWGAKDRWVPITDAQRFQADIKGARLVVFDQLGHNPMEEDPGGTAAALVAFLKPIPPRTPPPDPGAIDPTVLPAVVPERD